MKKTYTVHCKLCNYYGNKGTIIALRKTNGIESRVYYSVIIRKNNKFDLPEAMLNTDNNPILYRIVCPRCGGINLID